MTPEPFRITVEFETEEARRAFESCLTGNDDDIVLAMEHVARVHAARDPGMAQEITLCCEERP